jgi:hypothetical protein
MSENSEVADSQPPVSAETLRELADAVRWENPDALWRWLDRMGNWEEREREARLAHPDRPFLRRLLIGGREDGAWWWLSAVCSLEREWAAADLQQLPPHIWSWPGLEGKTAELIYDFTADTLLWGDASARVDALEQSEEWLHQLDVQVRRLDANRR